MKSNNLNFQLLIVLLLISISNYSQHSDVDNIYLNFTSLTTIDLRSKELVGSSYIEGKFLPGKIANQQNTYLMRYNAFQDEMEVEIDEKEYYLPRSTHYSISIESLNKTYQILDFEEKGITKKGFFVVLFRGEDLSLFVQEKIKLYQETPAKLGFSQYEPPKLGRSKDKLFIGYKNNSAIELPNKTKDKLKLFTNKSSEVEAYAKKNKLSFNKSEDLILLIKFYNSLN